MAKLIGTDPNQVPTNADLGTMAYQDSKNTVLENAYINAKGADGLEMGEDYTSRNNSSRLFFNSNTATGNWSVFNNSGSLVFKSGAAAGSTSGNYTALSLTTSNVTIGGNLVVGNGSGIDFSATGDATLMSSELLDDYEEGTWSPGISSGSITGSYGSYTKIGRFIKVIGRVTGFSDTSSSARVAVTGLPYASKQGNEYESTGTAFARYVNKSAQAVYIPGNSSTLYFYDMSSGDWANQELDHSNLENSSADIYFSASYMTA